MSQCQFAEVAYNSTNNTFWYRCPNDPSWSVVPPSSGGGGGGGVAGVNSLNGIVGDITIAAGANITVTPSANTITISSTGGGGGGIAPPAGDIGGNTAVPTVISTHLVVPLPIVQGGTGTTLPSLIAGSNVTITGSWPNQTINSISGAGTVTNTLGFLGVGRLIIGNGGNDVKIGDLSGDISTSGTTVTTLLNVNSNVGVFTDATITVNAKGLITAATNGTGTYTKTIASGTAALGTTLITSGAKASTVTVAAVGVLSTDTLMADFNGDPTGVTGYVPSSGGMLTIIKFPSSGAVNFIVVNNTGGSITPGAITLNWRVVR